MRNLLPNDCPKMEDIVMMAASRLCERTSLYPAREIGAQLVVCHTSRDDGITVESCDIPIDKNRRELLYNIGVALAENGFLPAYGVLITEAWMVNKKAGVEYDEPEDTPPSKSKHRIEVLNISGSEVMGENMILPIEFSRRPDGTILPIKYDEAEMRSKIQRGGENILMQCLFQGAGSVVHKE